VGDEEAGFCSAASMDGLKAGLRMESSEVLRSGSQRRLSVDFRAYGVQVVE